MNQDQARNLADLVVSELTTRSGFDHWWYGIDPEIQDEIMLDIANVIEVNG